MRETKNESIQRFWDNADGAGKKIGRFSKEMVFVLTQLTGGCLVVVDKPNLLVEGEISRQRQEELILFPYAYMLP